MGTFDFLAPIAYINTIYDMYLYVQFVSFLTSYFDDPWTIPSSTMSYEGESHIRMAMPLSAVEIAYHAI